MAVSANDIRDHFAEFDCLSDTVINQWKAQAERRINLSCWGNKADDAILWLTGHLLKISQTLAAGLDAAPGPVTTRKVGDLSVSYSIPKEMGATFLASTVYGQYYLTLKRGVFGCRVLGAYSAAST